MCRGLSSRSVLAVQSAQLVRSERTPCLPALLAPPAGISAIQRLCFRYTMRLPIAREHVRSLVALARLAFAPTLATHARSGRFRPTDRAALPAPLGLT